MEDDLEFSGMLDVRFWKCLITYELQFKSTCLDIELFFDFDAVQDDLENTCEFNDSWSYKSNLVLYS